MTSDSASSADALRRSRPRVAPVEYLPDHSDYLHPTFRPWLDARRIEVVFEVGSCDGSDAVLLHRALGARVWAFEPNPYAVESARRRLAGVSGVTLVPRAAWKVNGRIPFYPVVGTRFGDHVTPTRVGASSCFRARDDYRETYEQTEIEVEAIRLDDFRAEQGIGRVDLVCLDVQGAALEVLAGMPDTLDGCSLLIAELETKPIYHGQALYPAVAQRLAEHGLQPAARVERDAWFGDYLFARQGDSELV